MLTKYNLMSNLMNFDIIKPQRPVRSVPPCSPEGQKFWEATTLRTSGNPPGFITGTQPAAFSPADAAVGRTAEEEGLAAGAEGNSRCWACLLLSFEMKVTECPFLGWGAGSPWSQGRERKLKPGSRGNRDQMGSSWLPKASLGQNL